MSHDDEREADIRHVKKAAKKRGPKPKVIDYTKLDAMCAIHCTGEECAAILGMDYDTLNAVLKRDGHGKFSDYFNIKGSNGKMSLRRKQYDQAMSGNATMLIWLGKQWLGQTDKHENNGSSVTTITNNIMPVPTADSIESWESSAQAQQKEILGREDDI